MTSHKSLLLGSGYHHLSGGSYWLHHRPQVCEERRGHRRGQTAGEREAGEGTAGEEGEHQEGDHDSCWSCSRRAGVLGEDGLQAGRVLRNIAR